MLLATLLVLLAGLSTSYTGVHASTLPPPTTTTSATPSVTVMDDNMAAGYTDEFVRFTGYYFNDKSDYDTPDHWDTLSYFYGIKKNEQFCLKKPEKKCWTPSKLLRYIGHEGPNIIRDLDHVTKHPTMIIQMFSGFSNLVDVYHLRINDVGEHPNIAKLVAHGEHMQPGKYSNYHQCFMADEAPTRTLHEMLQKAYTGIGIKSKIYKKATVRKIIKDILAGLQYLHLKQISHHGLAPERIYLFKGPGPDPAAHYTAKIGDFTWANRIKEEREMPTRVTSPTQETRAMRKPAKAQDIAEFAITTLKYIVGTLLFKAQKHTDPKNPCTQQHYTDAWVKEVCEIVLNVGRIYQNVVREKNAWTMEDLVKDAWLNGTN